MRSGLVRVCTDCRLRLPRPAARCPFCHAETVGPADPTRQRRLRGGPRWRLTRLGRVLRRLTVALGGLLLAPAPLALVLLPILVPLFGSDRDREPASLLILTFLGIPGLVLGWTIVVAMAIGLLLLVLAIPGAIAASIRVRSEVVPCVRDRPPASGPTNRSQLEAWLRRLRDRMRRVHERRVGKKLLIGFASMLALALAGLSLVIREPGFHPGTALLFAGFVVVIIALAGGTWWGTVQAGLDWVLGGPGLTRRPVDRGRQDFDAAREAEALLRDCTEHREPWRGQAHSSAPLRTLLRGEEAIARRVRGRVGDWAIDDVDVAPLTLRTAEGPDAIVRAEDWLVPIEVGEPAPVTMTPALGAWLEARGLPTEGPLELAEGCIAPGARVTLFGDEMDATVTEAGYRGGAAVRLADGEGPVVLRLD